MENRIDPKELLKKFSVEHFCATAEDYSKGIHDPTQQMAKPFSNIAETPHLLCNLGLLISGLKLGKSMVVLDFGAGTCWLSRFLNQLQCSTICVDASITALNIGKKLFDHFPTIGEPLQPPQFIHFNGHRIEVEDESVDRIICFDTFHHLPNPKEILREFFRILKPGGIAGFSEPGPHHSQSPQSQYEMRNYHVLENDVVLSEIKEEGTAIGFGDIYFKMVSHPDLDLDYRDYQDLLFKKGIPEKVKRHLFVSFENSVVFFMTKGQYVPDSRSHLGLKHHLDIPATSYRVRSNGPIHLEVTISNNGSAKWLHKALRDIGTVFLGIHLYDSNQKLINLDFFRSRFEEDILPGQKLTKTVSLTIMEKGVFFLGIDLVAEGICWFENTGSELKIIKVTVE